MSISLPRPAHRRAALQTAAARSHPRWSRAFASLTPAGPTAYLNLYGPPGTICSVPYADIIKRSAPAPCSLDGAIVFVGSGHSGVARADQPDTYHTAYSGSDGIDFSGTRAGHNGALTVVAQAPLSELASYQSRLNSLTGGQGRYTLAFSHYETVPPQVQQQLMSQHKVHDEG